MQHFPFNKNKFTCERIYLQHFYSTVMFLNSKRYSPLHINENIHTDLCNAGSLPGKKKLLDNVWYCEIYEAVEINV